jgi:8-oxo-dGTP pyrophosphatase MutT (NUDIX family)
LADYASLATLYKGAIERAGQIYPVAVDPLHRQLSGLIRLEGGPVLCDTDLLALGEPHLKRVLSDRPGLYDGKILCWLRTDGNSLIAAPGNYFDMLSTCDAILAEYRPHHGARPLRRRAHVASGDPIASGRGRAAGIGVSVVLTVATAEDPKRRKFIVGRRSRTVGTDPGLWHVAPSGMLEDDPRGRHLETTVSRELAEELGVTVTPADVASRGEVLGVAHDLLRLRPEVVLRLDLTPEESPDLTLGDGEFDELRAYEDSTQGIGEFWAGHPPSVLTPAAAGAIALLEATAKTCPTRATDHTGEGGPVHDHRASLSWGRGGYRRGGRPDQEDATRSVVDHEAGRWGQAARADPVEVAVAGHDQQVVALAGRDDLTFEAAPAGDISRRTGPA